MAKLHVLEHARGIGRGRGHKIAVGGKTRHRTVIENESVLPEHHPIARPPHVQGRERVDVKPIEEGAGIRSLHVDLAERGDVAKSDARAHRADLARHGLLPITFAGLREVLRAKPCAGLDEDRSARRGPHMRRRKSCRTIMLAAMVAGERADRDRREWGPKGRRAGLRDGPARELGHHRERVDVRGLALVGRHPERGVALEVLDRAEALARGERDVVDGDIVLEIDEGFLL